MTQTQRRSGFEGCLAVLGRGFVMRLAVSVYVIGIVVVSVLCGTIISPFLGIRGSDSFLFFFIGGIGLAFAGAMAALAVYVIRRNRSLDAAFEISGLDGRPYRSGGRQFHGTVDNRPVEVYLSHGPSLAIHIPVNLETETAIGTRSAVGAGLNRAINRDPLALDEPTYADMMVFAKDEVWTRRLLREEQVRNALDALLNYDSSEIRNLNIKPNEISFRLHRFSLGLLEDTQIQDWLTALVKLAHAAEAQPQPEIKIAPSTTEQRIRRSRINSPWMILGISLGTVVLVVVCSLLIMVPILLMGS